MFQFADVPITMQGLLSTLYVLVAVMIIIVLYHTMFIVVDLRKIVRRFEDITAQIESTILKPLAIIDEAFQWVMDHLEGKKAKKQKKGGMEVKDI